jgi:hypothetical protein
VDLAPGLYFVNHLEVNGDDTGQSPALTLQGSAGKDSYLSLCGQVDFVRHQNQGVHPAVYAGARLGSRLWPVAILASAVGIGIAAISAGSW